MNCIKKAFPISMLLIISIHLMGQNKLRVGVNAGSTYAKYRGNEVIKESTAGFGYLFGVSLEYVLKENLALKGNLNLERKSYGTNWGTVYDGAGDVHQSDFRINEDYLVLPVMLSYEFWKTNNFFINGGPYLGYLLSSKTKSDDYPATTNDRKNLDVGLAVGAGTALSLNGSNKLIIELRENLGLVNDRTLKTNAVNLVLGWQIDLSKE